MEAARLVRLARLGLGFFDAGMLHFRMSFGRRFQHPPQHFIFARIVGHGKYLGLVGGAPKGHVPSARQRARHLGECRGKPMFNILCRAAPAKYDTASAAFSAILSFEVQIAVTNSAINEKFADDTAQLDRWKVVYKALEKQRPIRNKLAHGKMIIVLNKSRTPSKHEPRFLPFFHYYTHKDRRTLFIGIRQTSTQSVRSSAN